MQTSPTDFLYKIGVVAALFTCAYVISTRESATFDPEHAFDLLIDSGFHLRESQQNLELLDQRKILITTGINAQSSRIIVEKLLLLDGRDSSRPIDLYLRTEGGWEADAFSVIDTMHSIQAPVHIHAMGEVHSAGLMILTAGTGQRIVYPNTILGFHATDPGDGELWQERYEQLWIERSQLPRHWIEQRDGDFQYFTAAEAIEYGVADMIVSPENTINK